MTITNSGKITINLQIKPEIEYLIEWLDNKTFKLKNKEKRDNKEYIINI